MRSIKEWLIRKIVGDQPVMMNINFADIVVKPGEHVIQKSILFK